MASRKMKLYLTPKPVGSVYQLFKKVDCNTCEIPMTTATLIIENVSPDTSADALLKWLKQAPGVVNQFTPYRLTVIEEK